MLIYRIFLSPFLDKLIANFREKAYIVQFISITETAKVKFF